ncbi:MAG: hypothetical protein L0214_13240 [candidate division NC10 bacterium]|nr:hypothetical protein [candidate division NC10 bacterium]
MSAVTAYAPRTDLLALLADLEARMSKVETTLPDPNAVAALAWDWGPYTYLGSVGNGA